MVGRQAFPFQLVPQGRRGGKFQVYISLSGLFYTTGSTWTKARFLHNQTDVAEMVIYKLKLHPWKLTAETFQNHPIEKGKSSSNQASMTFGVWSWISCQVAGMW